MREREVLKGRRIPYWQEPRTTPEALAKIKNASKQWEATTEEFIYRVGKWFLWLRHHLPHGEFENAVGQTRFKIRTVRNMMKFAADVDTAGRMIPYHPNPSYGVKPATIAVLEAPEDPEAKPKKPKHQGGESLAWSAAECAEKLFAYFETLTQRRSREQMEDVVAQFDELAAQYIEERDEERKALRGEEE